MKNAKKDKSKINFLGVKVYSNVLAFIIIVSVCAIILITGRTYRNSKLTYGKTETVTAQIIDVGTRWRGGTRLSKKGYIKFVYIVNGNKVINSIDSFHIRDNIEQYRIGNCIELLVSLENENVYKWNKSKGTFKCQYPPY
jgi:hypothetical protein